MNGIKYPVNNTLDLWVIWGYSIDGRLWIPEFFWILHNFKKGCTQYTKLLFLQGLREVIVRQYYSFFEVDSQIRTLDLTLLDFWVLNATNHCVVC